MHVGDTSRRMQRDLDQTRAGATVAAGIASITRATTWTLVDELPLRFDAHHPQGMARVGSNWWISTVDINAGRGLVMVVDERGELVEQIPIGDHQRYHPGGMDFDGAAFWIPCAEYRPDSSTTVYRLAPGRCARGRVRSRRPCRCRGPLRSRWRSRRLVMGIAALLPLVGGRPARRGSDQSGLLRRSSGLPVAPDRPPVVRRRRRGHPVVGTRLARWARTARRRRAWSMQREVPFPIYSPASGRVATHNPIWAEVSGDQLIVNLLPDDGAGVDRRLRTLARSTPIGLGRFQRVDLVGHRVVDAGEGLGRRDPRVVPWTSRAARRPRTLRSSSSELPRRAHRSTLPGRRAERAIPSGARHRC